MDLNTFFPKGKPDFLAVADYLNTLPIHRNYALLIIGLTYRECNALRATLPKGFGDKFKGDIYIVYPDGGDTCGWHSIHNKNVLGCVMRAGINCLHWPEFSMEELYLTMTETTHYLGVPTYHLLSMVS